MAIHDICNLCRDTGYIGNSEMLYCTCMTGVRCEREDNIEVQFVINMAPVDISDDNTDGLDQDVENWYNRLVSDDTSNITDDDSDLEHYEHKMIFNGKDIIDIETYVRDREIVCIRCNSSGYTSMDPIKYCGCPVGLLYDGKAEEAAELANLKLGFVSNVLPEGEYNKLVESINIMGELPFECNVLFPGEFSFDTYTHSRDWSYE